MTSDCILASLLYVNSTIKAFWGNTILTYMDDFENRAGYRRNRTTVQTNDGELDAWIYDFIGFDGEVATDFPRAISNDFLTDLIDIIDPMWYAQLQERLKQLGRLERLET